ncbi:hypothetical protein [Bacillus cereus]|uniref:hypothetical protein n=1 Tax=Bacillus cereus TaxID=1396 RepID=UPI0015D4DB4B|nr:hypothetical protein [Bacillus cereus]
MKTVIEIEAAKGKRINYDNIKRVMHMLNERYGNNITVKFMTDGTYTVGVNKE